jgi:hypothetical protein
MLTGINSVNSNQVSNQVIIESYLRGYRNGYEHAKVKLIEAACEWLENNIENYVTQVDSDAWINSELEEDFKKYLTGVLVD